MFDHLRRPLGLAAATLLCLAMSGLAHAHPHGWIDLRMRLVVDDEGRLTGLHQSWRMDPFYSLVVLEELGQTGGEGGLEAALDQLGSEIRDNLVPYGYYTELYLGDQKQAFDAVNDYTVLERGGRIEFIFLLPLAEPQPLAGQTLRYQVFDPTYYIEMVHEEEERVPAEDALLVGGELACETRIRQASPDPELVMRAAMLDVDDEAEPGLGRHFAETGEVTCR
ncbi:DUF1007 family protein [Halomonas sp. A11-A]|uniref:DUF1007 family protein n=1 Tax=Halomonas sp. A11-A TaxID=2183985 RepID=UPI000D71D175|nr:DUF1007 family protein [Halomonas sp. A11-A]PWV72365.1 ABC-type uncharacterized transport system substrate-binding protein [Halomonas sp. A11-A]